MAIPSQTVKQIFLFAALLAAVVIVSLAHSENAYAEAVYTYQDMESSTKLPAEDPYISGKHMVWQGEDSEGHTQIFYQKVDGGTPQQITNGPSLKDIPQVGEAADGKVYIVWTDRRNFAENQAVWDLYSFELTSGREWKLNGTHGFYGNFSVSGSDVVAYDNYTKNMTHFNLAQNKEALLGKGRSPSLANGRVVFINPEDGGLSLIDLATGTKRSLLTLPYHLNVIDVIFNGTYVLYKQADLDWHTKYVTLNVDDPNGTPKALTPATKKNPEYYQLYIGNNEAAWIEDNNGTKQLIGVNLQKSESHLIAQGEAAGAGLAFSGDRLLTRTPNGNLSYKTIIRTEPASASSGSSGGSSIPLGTIRKTVGAAGGDLSAADGKVKLHVPQGAVTRDTEMELRPDPEMTNAMYAAGTAMRPASQAWSVSAGSDLLKNVELGFTFEADKWTELQTNKMGVYRYDRNNKSWAAIGGRLDAASRTVTADINFSDTYALFANDVSFGDVQGHWAAAYIETLAAKGIVNGMTDDRFDPESLLTRAQFTKMLLSALGQKPENGYGSNFSDVPSSHWAAGWVVKAAAMGLVQGDGEHFNPDAELTREQMIVMLMRALQEEKRALSLSEAEIQAGLQYGDADELSGWAKADAALSSKYGLIEGAGGNLFPKQSSTRAQAAAVIYRLLTELKQI